MQTENDAVPINITVRHETVTDSLRDYATKKVEGLHMDYPRIIEARVILDVQKNRHIAEIILFCTNNIVIDAHTEGDDMYAAIDETIDKIARRTRKQKTRLMKKRRPHRNESIRYIDISHYDEDALDHAGELEDDEDAIPFQINTEGYSIRPMYREDAAVELQLSDRPFVLYRSVRRDCLTILWRRKDGEYAAIDLPNDIA